MNPERRSILSLGMRILENPAIVPRPTQREPQPLEPRDYRRLLFTVLRAAKRGGMN